MANSTAFAGRASAEIAPLRLGGSDGWGYAPAPESTDHVELRDRYGLFIDGEFTDAKGGRTFETTNPATEEKIADVALAGEADVDRAVAAARRAYDEVWSRLAPSERGKYIYRIARVLQERGREMAITESLDGGKPIRESRDVDIPLAAAHFFYYAGLGRQGGLRLPRPRRPCPRRRRPGHPVELPAAHGGLEDRAGVGRRQHGRAQAGRDDTAHGAQTGRDRP